MLGFDVDMSSITAGIQRLANDLPKAKSLSVLDVGFEVLRLSQMEVPHDKGTLQNSGTVQQIDDMVVVGYHTPYAARLHEHPEYHFQAGRKGKYLEDPILNNLDTLGLKFAEKFEGELYGNG